MSDKKNEDYVVRMPNTGFDRRDRDLFRSSPPAASLSQSMSKLDNSPLISVLAYCASSISMTIVNKYVVSGKEWNVNFFYLTIQVQ